MIGKSVFIWNVGAVYGGDVKRIAGSLAEAGFQSAMLHYQSLATWRSTQRVALIGELRAVGVEPIGSAAVYGGTPVLEGQQAAAICRDYNLAAFVFDAESAFDAADPSGQAARTVLNTFRQECDARAGWCWWARYKNPATGSAWHPVAVLNAAMALADFGVPMMYWSGSSTDAAVALAEQSFTQWREVTEKPLVPAGRAYIGDGGTGTPEAIRAFEAYFKPYFLSGDVDGVTWWSMEHAISTGLWEALAALPAFGEAGPPENGENMTNGIVLSDESNLLDAKAVKAAGYEFAFVRARKTINGTATGGKDDQRVTQHRDALRGAGLQVGVFADFDHRNVFNAAGQAGELAGMVRQDDLLPPGIRLWDVKGAEGKALAITDWYEYANRLSEMVYYVFIKTHRWPVILANQNQVKQITAQMGKLSLDAQSNIRQAWWGVIGAPGEPPVLPAPWTKYPFFVEFTSSGQTVSGAGNIALAHWPGTLAQLQTWTGNPTMENLPAWGSAPAPQPEPTPEPTPVDLSGINAKLDSILEQLGKLAWLGK